MKHLRARGGGAIINLGSVLSDRAVIKQPAYSAAKAAVRAMTESVRMDVEREGLPISVTLIKPTGDPHAVPRARPQPHGRAAGIPQVIYAPELVADAILFAAEHSRRQIYVGGYGFMLSTLARLLPRSTDRIMESLLVRTQQSPDEPGDPARSRQSLRAEEGRQRRGLAGLCGQALEPVPRGTEASASDAPGILGSGLLAAGAARRRLAARHERT